MDTKSNQKDKRTFLQKNRRGKGKEVRRSKGGNVPESGSSRSVSESMRKMCLEHIQISMRGERNGKQSKKRPEDDEGSGAV